MEISIVEFATSLVALAATIYGAWQKNKNIGKNEELARAQNTLNTINIQAHQLANAWKNECERISVREPEGGERKDLLCARAENDLRTVAMTARALMGAISTDNSAYNEILDNAINIQNRLDKRRES